MSKQFDKSTLYAYRLLFLGGDFRGAHHLWGDPYLNSTTVLFDNYTTKWIEIVNRGGFFPIHNKSFQFFIAFESVVVQMLSTSYVSTAVKGELCIKSHTLNTCSKNEQVLEKFYTEYMLKKRASSGEH